MRDFRCQMSDFRFIKAGFGLEACPPSFLGLGRLLTLEIARESQRRNCVAERTRMDKASQASASGFD